MRGGARVRENSHLRLTTYYSNYLLLTYQGGLAFGALGAGDAIVSVGGVRAASAAAVARQLRALCGEVPRQWQWQWQ